MAPLVASSALLALALALLSGPISAEPGVVGLQFTKREVLDPAEAASLRRFRKRQASTHAANIYNAQGDLLYLVNTTVGTPPQQVSLQLDTGSSDIWIPTSSSSICSKQQRCTSGSYNQQSSSSFAEVLQGNFLISYVDGTKIAGDYINETFGIAGVSLKQMTMGTALQAQEPNTDSSTPFQGIVGVAFDSGEAIVGQSNGQYGYPNVISQMVLQNVISTRAYSLWLNDLESSEGNILFGGVDDAKFNGPLTILPLQVSQDTGVVDSFTVVFAGINITGNGGKTVYNQAASAPVILDSGTTLTYLPDAIANAISDGVGAVNSNQYGVVVPCNVADTQGQLLFQFGDSNGPVIKAEISQFVLPFPASAGTAPKFKNGQTACRWGILAAGSNPNLFGDTFLRSAYVVYNLDGQQIGIAETKFNVTTSDIKQITASSSLPGATSTASGTAKATQSGPIFNTDVGGTSGAAATGLSAAQTGLFDLGTATGSSGSSATSKAAAPSLIMPSTPFVGVIAAGVSVLLGLVGGSVLILA